MTRAAIGNITHALRATLIDEQFKGFTWEREEELPIEIDGWTFIGVGSYRRVYLNPAKTVVYKVEIGMYEGAGNVSEYHTCRRLRKRRSRQYYVPRVHLFTDVESRPVLAMEYIPGPHPEYDDDYSKLAGFSIYDAEVWSGTGDLHEGNCKIAPDGRLALLDLGT
jgi:hypothetical protein